MSDPTPSPAPSSNYIPLVSDASRVVRVLFSPGAVFEEQRDKPTWFMPWLVISLVVVAVGLFSMPYTDRMMELAMQARGGGGQPVPAGVRTFSRVMALIGAPIYFLLLGAIGAGVMWVTLMISGGKVRYRGLMSAAIFSMATGVLQMIAQVVVMRMRGTPQEAIRTMQDARVTLGLDLLLPAEATVSPFLRTLMAGVGPLQIWALIITAVGVMVLERQDKGNAWMAATASYIVLLVVGALLAGLGGGGGAG